MKRKWVHLYVEYQFCKVAGVLPHDYFKRNYSYVPDDVLELHPEMSFGNSVVAAVDDDVLTPGNILLYLHNHYKSLATYPAEQ